IDHVVADPPEHVVLEATEQAREWGAEIVVGLGGGCSMEVAQLLAVLLGGDQPLTDMYGIGHVRGARLPLVQVPTTAGAGAPVSAMGAAHVARSSTFPPPPAQALTLSESPSSRRAKPRSPVSFLLRCTPTWRSWMHGSRSACRPRPRPPRASTPWSTPLRPT